MTGARAAAVTALLRISREGGYSPLVLEEILNASALSESDRALTTRLVYGVTERRLTLDFLLNRLSSTPVIKMDDTVREILRVGVYQLVFLDKTPDFAAVNEAVALTRQRGFSRLTGYVNGVLRAAQRESAGLLAGLPPTDKGLELRYSCPRAWIRVWRAAYGEDLTRRLLETLNDPPPAYIRVNTLKTTPEELTAVLREHGITVTPVTGLPAALEVSPAQALRRLPPEWQDRFYWQDIASQWCCRALSPRPGERIADVCAAPGGKSMTVLQEMNGQGTVDATDLHDDKCRIMAERAARYGIPGLSVTAADASAEPPTARIGAYDRVICDVPCSGLGVIRRKPEIRYKTPEELSSLPALQRQILEQAARLVKPGGVLQYSTCTLRPEENQQVTAAFLAAHPEFSPRVLPIPECFAAAGIPPANEITLSWPLHGSDGFYIAGFSKK